MRSFPKPTRERDEEYLEFIRSLPCAVSGRDAPSEPHHWQKKGHGGRGTKCPDRRAIPLSFELHREIHQIGKETFAKKYGIDVEATIKMYNSLKERIDAVSGHNIL